MNKRHIYTKYNPKHIEILELDFSGEIISKKIVKNTIIGKHFLCEKEYRLYIAGTYLEYCPKCGKSKKLITISPQNNMYFSVTKEIYDRYKKGKV